MKILTKKDDTRTKLKKKKIQNLSTNCKTTYV